LVSADQNTPAPATGGGNNVLEDPYEAGRDVYEWRDGRQILVTDGLSHWTTPPTLFTIDSSGRDIFFTASAQYTADALDANMRLYDARIDGGIDFPPPAKACPLEVCQGTPRGAPQEQEPSSTNFSGGGNPTTSRSARCRKGKVRHKGHCAPRQR